MLALADANSDSIRVRWCCQMRWLTRDWRPSITSAKFEYECLRPTRRETFWRYSNWFDWLRISEFIWVGRYRPGGRCVQR
jgi:hypothetical protein